MAGNTTLSGSFSILIRYVVPSIIKKLNHMPMGALDYVFPIEALKAVYENTT